MEVLLVAVVLAVVVLLIVAPLRRGAGESIELSRRSRLADLEARKEAKLREIRDAELDFRMGKLSDTDWKALDRELRKEAISLLRQIDELDGVPQSTGGVG